MSLLCFFICIPFTFNCGYFVYCVYFSLFLLSFFTYLSLYFSYLSFRTFLFNHPVFFTIFTYFIFSKCFHFFFFFFTQNVLSRNHFSPSFLPSSSLPLSFPSLFFSIGPYTLQLSAVPS